MNCSRKLDLMLSLIAADPSNRSHGVAGAWYFLLTRAPSRVLALSLNDGWKKLM